MLLGLYNDKVSVSPSVCLSSYRPLHQRVAGLLLWAQQAGDIDQLQHGRRSAAMVLQ